MSGLQPGAGMLEGKATQLLGCSLPVTASLLLSSCLCLSLLYLCVLTPVTSPESMGPPGSKATAI